MALLPGAKGADILAWRGVSEVVGEIRRRSAERIASLLAEESISLLRNLRGRLEQEIAFEEGFSAEASRALEALERAGSADDFSLLLPRFNRLAEQYFRKRGSVVALHNFCNSYRDGLVRLLLLRTEERLAEEGMGRAPAPYCWLASGSMGRGEQTFCVAPSALLIYGDAPDGAGFFEQLASRAVALMEKISLVTNDGGATAMERLWRGSRKQWRREVAGKTAQGGEGLSGLAGCADLRPIYGDPVLAEEMINVVRSMLDAQQGALRDMGKELAEMPTGLDFFNRLRLERRGRHRGEFDLEQYALAPLIANVRMLAIACGLRETNTIARIKGLQEQGRLSVELTDRLVRAYHDLTSLKVQRQLAAGCADGDGCFIDPQGLTADQESRLRNGLEAVSGLEKIAYLSFTEQK